MVVEVTAASNETYLDKRPTKKSRACVHCHVRKVRCNAWEVGIPCTRCCRRNEASTCVLVGASHAEVLRCVTSTDVPNIANKDKALRTTNRRNGARQKSRSTLLFSRTSSVPQRGEHRAPEVEDVSESLQERLSTYTSPHENVPEHHQDVYRHSSEQPDDSELRDDLRPTPNVEPVREEDIHRQICDEMSSGRPIVMSPTSTVQACNGREIIEYHGGVNSVTILGEALGQQRANRLVKVIVLNDSPSMHQWHNLPGLDSTDLEYLTKKGALSLPPRQYCDEFLRLYFKFIYPYAPVLDRIKFMTDYSLNQYSLFLMQSILANVVPHAPEELLQACGYENRIVAQKLLFTKAKLLYDMGCEKSQLHLLQGSVMLSSLSFSYAIDKDYRYWLTNAARIAVQMGLNRNSVSASLEPESRKLLRRVWWVLYNRDTLLAISGIDNLRRFNDRYCDTEALTESDLEEAQDVPEKFRHILPPLQRLQNLFMVEYSKLSIISGYFIRDFKSPGRTPTAGEVANLSDQIATWRKQLPDETQLHIFHEWTEDNYLTLVLLAMGFRLEAVFCRSMKAYHRANNEEEAMQRSTQRQERAMFELSTVIQRASMHGLLHLCPLSFMTCASTNLAMRIEIALDSSTGPRKQLAARTQIFAELEYLRESCEYWNSLIWTLRMLEAVIARTNLGLTPVSRKKDQTKPGTRGTFDFSNTVPNDDVGDQGVSDNLSPTGAHSESFQRASETQVDAHTLPGVPGSTGFNTGGRTDNLDTLDPLIADPMSSIQPLAEDFFGMLPVLDGYDWLQDPFGTFADKASGEDFLNRFNSDGPSGLG